MSVMVKVARDVRQALEAGTIPYSQEMLLMPKLIYIVIKKVRDELMTLTA